MSTSDQPAAETPDETRRRLARAFGNVLPEQTSDDTVDESEESSTVGDTWLRAQVPPHHGD